MGFCGCSLHASTISAGVYGIIFSLYGISWSSAVISIIREWTLLNPLMDPYVANLFSSENFFFLMGDKVIYGMIVATLLLHLAWIISSIAMLFGNERENTASLQVWVGIVSVVIITDFSFSIYATMKPSDLCGVLQLNFTKGFEGFCFGYLLLAVLFNKFGLITIGIEIALAIYVSNRVKEMKRPAPVPSQITVYPPAAQYIIPGGSVVTMQSYPSDFQQMPSYHPPQDRIDPPPFSTHGANKVALPQRYHPDSRY